jgi:hypothetical protein
MKQRTASLLLMSCLLAAPLLAQTTIGGVACNSGLLNGAYAVAITGRQVTTQVLATDSAVKSHVTTSGAFVSVFQANGSANFDGQSQVTISLTAETAQAVATPLTWSGTYSVQANCAGVINITTGGTATLNLALYRVGLNPITFDFLMSGSDATYTYSGSGNTQPTGCSAGTFDGVYTFNGTGFALTGTAVSGAQNGTGLLQFDGVSAVTVNVTMATLGAAPSALTLTGSYSVTSNCLGSAALKDASNNSYAMSFSIYNSTVANAASYVGLVQGSKFIIAGNVHAAYGQPAASAAVHRWGDAPALVMVAKPKSGSAYRGGRA